MTIVQEQPLPITEGAAIPAVKLEGVAKRFGRGAAPTVLEDVTLTVAPGEFVCVLGASGCGKSTLLNLIAGLDGPTAGTVEVAGGRPGSHAAGEGAALMFQESALFPWLTAGKNVELALRLRGVPRSERRAEADRLLGLVRLNGSAGKRVHQLSGGMRQRVALARALAQATPVLLMDEPFAALDAITRDLLHEELIRIWSAAGRSVVFVTHNVQEAVRLGERIVLFSSRPGRPIQEWRVTTPQPRAADDPEVAELTAAITDALRREIRRHVR